LTDAGRARAAIFLEQNQYLGQLPVPLEQYRAYVAAFVKNAPVAVSRVAVRQAFKHLVLSDRVLDHLGPAIAARHSLFIYGAPGNGKTVISQSIRNLLVGDIAIPHALSIEGNIVHMFDPGTHNAIEEEVSDGLQRVDEPDRRWVLCKRPLVTVGGELDLDDLEIGYSHTSRCYRAPLQLLANGGVFVIDDFGRQHASPRDLLNRWITPLESRADSLALQTGQKFEVPFEVFIVFATNLKPADLVDEAFLRRIQFKVFAQSPTPEEFIKIFENCCDERNLPFDRTLATALLDEGLRPRNAPLRACQPRDLIDRALSLAAYLDRPRELTSELLASACQSYFVEDEQVSAA
jgi:predicted ATPase with chaperone activity